MSLKTFSNAKVSFSADMSTGKVHKLNFAQDKCGMNYLISPEVARRYEYDDMCSRLLGGSILSYCGHDIDTGLRCPDRIEELENGVSFIYDLDRICLKHTFTVEDDAMVWDVSATNTHSVTMEIETLVHWMPVAYVMHKQVENNMDHAVALVPSICGSNAYAVCKKRSGKGADLIVYNETGEMKSIGSYCRFTNLFFEKSSPSLNGMIAYNAVNAWKGQERRGEMVDWQYNDMYRSLYLEPGEVFADRYRFVVCEAGEDRSRLIELGASVVDFEPVVLYGKAAFTVNSKKAVKSARVLCADSEHVYEEKLDISIDGNYVVAGDFKTPGERKIVFTLEDDSEVFVVFAVYASMQEMVEEICNYVYADRFVSDPEDPNYCAYKSISLQGESCAKGTLLLYKNLISATPDADQVRQAEMNTVNFVLPNWFDEDMVPLKKYPGNFARLADIHYIAQQTHLLSKFGDMLVLHTAEEYLKMAYDMIYYCMVDTPDKSSRERDEMGGTFFTSWEFDFLEDLRMAGFNEEADTLARLAAEDQKKFKNFDPATSVITEHYFDNAGLSIRSHTLLKNGFPEKGMQVADFLIPNVAESNDYRNYAPDRWWEALAPMYHNLWAAYCARAMLTAYEYSHDYRHLVNSYRSMVPLFYCYDWNAVSALRGLEKGEGVSTYCLTAPNMNLDFCSHNRFGQSVFHNPFFDRLQLAGDDWDMGMDVLLYLETFGQKTFVSQKDGSLLPINGTIAGDKDDMWVDTFAPYSAQFYIEPLDLTIRRNDTTFTLEGAHIVNGKCTQIRIRGNGEGDVTITQNGKVIDEKPEVIRI